MASYLTRISRWLRGGKEKKPVSNGSTPSTSYSDWGLSTETMKFSLDEVAKMASSPRKVKRKRQSKEERRFDREYDAVLVSDGSEFLSGSESDDSDWSIGWTERHGPDFVTDDDESDNTFAVLVACYKRRGCKKVEPTNNEFLNALKILPNDFSSAGKNYMEEWLAFLQKFDA